MSKKIELVIGVTTFAFSITNADYNKFINAMAKGKTIQPAFNLLSDTVEEKQREELLSVVLDSDKQPIGPLVMEVLGEITEEFSDGLPAVVKKRKSIKNNASKVATTS